MTVGEVKAESHLAQLGSLWSPSELPLEGEVRSPIPHELACFSLFPIGELTLVNDIFSKESETTLLL